MICLNLQKLILELSGYSEDYSKANSTEALACNSSVLKTGRGYIIWWAGVRS
jgi:hypothetical protein